MTYRIRGLDPAPFAELFGLDEEALRDRGAARMIATHRPGFPCRITLEDARPGEALILVHHVSNDVPGPFRTGFAIFVRETATRAMAYDNALPPIFATRIWALRGFDEAGMLVSALIAAPSQVEDAIEGMFAEASIESIHAHNHARGCFLARIERG